MSGSHWVSLVKVKGKREHIIYDSFGRPHTRIIPTLKTLGGKLINTDKDSEQRKSENNCGQRSLGFLIFYDTYGKKQSMLI